MMTIVQEITAVLMLVLSGRRDGACFVSGKTPSGIDTGISMWIPAAQLDPEFLPPALLTVLEQHCWALRVDVGGYRDSGAQRPVRLGVLPVWWRVPLVDRDRQIVPDPDRLALARAALDKFTLVPTALVLGGEAVNGGRLSIVALFALAEPLPVEADEGPALDLLRRLAVALDADPLADDASLRDLSVPLPGTPIRESEREDVQLLRCDPACQYSLAAIEAALSPSTAPKRPRSSRNQEAATV